jgi:hypothetical protein
MVRIATARCDGRLRCRRRRTPLHRAQHRRRLHRRRRAPQVDPRDASSGGRAARNPCRVAEVGGCFQALAPQQEAVSARRGRDWPPCTCCMRWPPCTFVDPNCFIRAQRILVGRTEPRCCKVKARHASKSAMFRSALITERVPRRTTRSPIQLTRSTLGCRSNSRPHDVSPFRSQCYRSHVNTRGLEQLFNVPDVSRQSTDSHMVDRRRRFRFPFFQCLATVVSTTMKALMTRTAFASRVKLPRRRTTRRTSLGSARHASQTIDRCRLCPPPQVSRN